MRKKKKKYDNSIHFVKSWSKKNILYLVTGSFLFKEGETLLNIWSWFTVGLAIKALRMHGHRWISNKCPPRYCFTIYEFYAISSRHLAKSRRPFPVTAYERLRLFHVVRICWYVWENLLLDFNIFFSKNRNL